MESSPPSSLAAASVRFALRRFRGERLWGRKVAAYNEVFDALYQVQSYARMELSRWEEGAEFTQEHRNELLNHANLGYESIRKPQSKGLSLLVSRPLVDSLSLTSAI